MGKPCHLLITMLLGLPMTVAAEEDYRHDQGGDLSRAVDPFHEIGSR